METLRDWTTYGADGDAASTSLRYFSGTATYRTTISGNGEWGTGNGNCTLSLGNVPTGLAHVFVNGVDCGVAWCAPWEVDISSAVREGENKMEIRYTNNWYNRLVGDCFLPEGERVTRTTLRYWTMPRERSDAKRPRLLKPSVYSGPAISDPLQSSGLLGPVVVNGAKNNRLESETTNTFTLAEPVENAWIVVDGMGLRAKFAVDGKPARHVRMQPYR
jgi:hypothetical protein